MTKSIFLLALAGIFTAGKLSGNIDWPWWAVLLPAGILALNTARAWLIYLSGGEG